MANADPSIKMVAGPIPRLNPNWFDPFPETPGFEIIAAGDGSGLDALESQMDALLSPTAALDALIPDTGELGVLDAMPAALDSFAAPLDVSASDNVIDAEIPTRDAQLVHVYDIMPPEGWGPPLPPLVGYGAPPPVVSTRVTSGAIKNLSNPGSPGLFGVGDSYEFDLAGFVQYGGTFVQGVLVRGYFTKNGVKVLVPWNRNADAQGNVTFSGTWTAADVGHWSGFFDSPAPLAGGQYTTQVPDWDVQAGPVPLVPITGPPGVTIENFTTPGAQSFKVGDQFTVTINGNPGDDVIVSLVWNGSQLTPVSVGKIDASGVLQIFGTFAAWQVGTYVETYILNGVPLPGTLNFAVS